MKKQNILFILFVVVLFIYTTNIFAQDNRKTVQVNKGDYVDLILQSGDLEVFTWNQPEIEVKWDGDSDSRDQIIIDKKGNNIKIISQGSDADDFKVTVPAEINLSIKSQAGDIDVKDNLSGELNIASGGGDVTVRNVGSNAKLTTGGGDIKTGDIKGDCMINSAGGDITVGNVSKSLSVNTAGGNVVTGTVGGEVKISTAGGNVQTKNIDGTAKVSTSGGNINLGTTNGTAKISTGGGNIQVSGINGSVKASTGGGNVELGKVTGGVSVATGSGNVHVDLTSDKKIEESKIAAGNGNVTLEINKNSKATIEVNVGFEGVMTRDEIDERVISNLEPDTVNIDGEDNNLKVVYLLNGGGTLVKIANGDGNVTVTAK